MDLSLKFDNKLNNIKIKNKCVYVLKYYLIHSYDCELVFLLQTLGILRMKYPNYNNFIETNIQNVLAPDERRSEINSKIQLLVNSINSHNYYDLYQDIISTLYC